MRGIPHSFGCCERYAERFGRVYFKLAPIEEWSTGAVFALIAAQQREHATSAAGEKAETFPFSLSAMRRSRFSQANQPKPASENASVNEQSEDLPMEFPAAEEIEAAFSPMAWWAACITTSSRAMNKSLWLKSAQGVLHEHEFGG